MARLSIKLAEDGRIADISKVTTDNNYLKQREFGIKPSKIYNLIS